MNPATIKLIAIAVVIGVLAIWAGVETIKVANRDVTIANMKSARDKEVADAAEAEVKYKDQDRKANERRQEAYLATKAQLETLQRSSNARVAAAGNSCPAVLDAVLDGLRPVGGPPASSAVPARSAASPLH